MGIKSILTLFAVGGIAGAAFYFRDGITDAFATTKQTVSDAKDILQEGAGGNDSYVEPVPIPDNNKPENVKTENPQYIYVPIYQNGGQQSTQDKYSTTRSKSNPTITQYIKQDKRKTESSISKFSSPWARENTTQYAKQKYGIDYNLLTKAVSKSPSRRTINEKKQIEAEKARQIFDSRKINNW